MLDFSVFCISRGVCRVSSEPWAQFGTGTNSLSFSPQPCSCSTMSPTKHPLTTSRYSSTPSPSRCPSCVTGWVVVVDLFRRGVLQVGAVVTCRRAVVTAEHLQGQAGDGQRRFSLS